MTSAARSTSCWSCKLRRKKCDEGLLPSCATCHRLEIICYRSDTKPEFMDGGEKEKRKILEIRALVKAKNDSLRRSRALEAVNRKRFLSESENACSGEASARKIRQCTAAKSQENVKSEPIRAGIPIPPLPPSSMDYLDIQDLSQEQLTCELWVHVLIDQIDTLSTEQEQPSNDSNNASTFHSKADKIRKSLEDGIRCSQERYIKLEARTPDHNTHPSDFESHHRKINILNLNCAYVFATLIYLHITIHGTDSRTHPDTGKMVFEWLFAFRFLPDNTLLPSLVWPLCIAGCMATSLKDQEFFWETVVKSGIDRGSSCMIWTALEIMETCWKRGESHGMLPGSLDWMRSLDVLRSNFLIKERRA